MSCSLEEERAALTVLLFWKAAVRPEHLEWRLNRGRWACMVPVGAVTVHVTAAAPAIAPGIPHTKEKASSPPAFETSLHPPANTTVVGMLGENRGLIWMSCLGGLQLLAAAVQNSWLHLSTGSSDMVYISAVFGCERIKSALIHLFVLSPRLVVWHFHRLTGFTADISK